VPYPVGLRSVRRPRAPGAGAPRWAPPGHSGHRDQRGHAVARATRL